MLHWYWFLKVLLWISNLQTLGDQSPWDKSQSLAFVKQYLGSISPVMKAGATAMYSIIFSEEHVLWKLPKHWCWVPKRWYWVLELNRERRWDLHSPLDLAKNYLPLHISSNCQEDQLTPGSDPHSKIYSYNKGSCPVNGVMVSYLFTNVIQVHRHFDSSKVH